MTWEFGEWFGLTIRIIVTSISVWLLIRLLREKVTVARANTTIAWIIALGILWIANIEGATRLVFLGFEIENRIENAQAILDRLNKVEDNATNTEKRLLIIQEKASKLAIELKIY